MPRATRNTYTSSGKEVSAPPKPNTWSKKNALTPSAAANDSTTVAVRISGATSARSKIARMTNTTARISGSSSLLSWVAARATSRLTAVWPPTRAWPPRNGGAGTADDHDRLARPGREVGREQRLTLHRVGVAAEHLRVGQPVGL